MTAISIRIPDDVIEDLKTVAPLRGFSGYQPLLRAYIGQGLRADLELLDSEPKVEVVIEKLREHGIPRRVLNQAIAEARLAKKSA